MNTKWASGNAAGNTLSKGNTVWPPLPFFKCRVTFQKGAQVSAPLILSIWAGAVLTLPCPGIRLEPWVKIKPRYSICISTCDTKQSELIFSQWETRCRSLLVHLNSTCVMLHYPPPRTNTRTGCWSLIHHQTSSMHRCTQEHKGTNWQLHTQAHCSQMSPTNRPWRGRCSDAETGAI